MRIWLLLYILMLTTGSYALQETERYAIIAGVNYGGTQREMLKYAHTDAKNMSSVLSEIGGIPVENQIVIMEPSAEAFNGALKRLSKKLSAAKSKNKREVVLYFSGHANEKGLIFGNEHYDYQILRKDIDSIPAQVKITVLDACASGAITRMKGGYRKQAFLIDASNNLSGYAFITSSTNNEGAQESDLIGGSFFTHYLVSGMRGAADVSQDGVITLGEAYQFAFTETLNRTQNTSGGTQHPSYDMKLSGSGDIVMSDLRNSERSIIFGKDIVGRIYVKTKTGKLITELYKNSGRTIELGLAGQKYHISLEESKKWKEADVDLETSMRVMVDESNFSDVYAEQTRRRGDEPDTVPVLVDTVIQNTPVLKYRKKDAYALQVHLMNTEWEKEGGTQISLFANTNQKRMSGSQITLLGFNNAYDDVGGMQWSLWSNYARGEVGFGQISLIANSVGRYNGVQISSIVNKARDGGRGMRLAGGVNILEGTASGLQCAGIMNVGMQGVFNGLQIALLANSIGTINGVSVAGGVNNADTANGVQASLLLNKAKVVRGVQVGLINISEEMYGLPIGIINYSKNGQFTANVWRDELDMEYLTVKSGSSHFYTFVTWGRNFTHDNSANALGAGFGFRFGADRLYGEIDLQELWFINKLNLKPDDDDLITKGGINLDVKLFEYLSLYGGVSYNVLANFDNTRVVNAWSAFEQKFTHLNTGMYGWPGIQFGFKVGRF